MHEALRLHERYLREIVESFAICPWSKSARLEGRMRSHVATASFPEPGALRPIVDAWAKDETVEVAFVITPRFEVGADAFEQWASQVGSIDAAAFLSAAFHPSPRAGGGTIRFLRQTPDPTVQLVRRTRLDEIRAQDPPHYRDIFDLDVRDLSGQGAPRTVAASVLAHNERMLADTKGELQQIIDDIGRDRDETYARIL